jgi:hypothetical protein
MSELYENDIAAWAARQADLLRRRARGERINVTPDWDNIAEEIADVGRSEEREVESRLAIACEHLLKWEFQPRLRTNSWRASVVQARTRIARVIRRNPSLKSYPATVLADAYQDGRDVAEAETGLLHLPETCPWTVEQVLDRTFWPGLPWEADEP